MNLSLILLILKCAALCVRASDYVLWYETPAYRGMNEALPIGNGRVGALIYGHPEQERLSMNEISLWTGNDNPQMAYKGNDDFGNYQVLGNIFVNIPDHKHHTNYRRELDIGDSLSRVSYISNGAHFKREYFVSHVTDVLVGQLSADRNGSYKTGSIEVVDSRNQTSVAMENTIRVSGHLINGMKYEWQLVVLHSGGSLSVNGSKIEFKNCDSLTLIAGAGTDYVMDSSKKFKGDGPESKVRPNTKSASLVSYEKQREEHIKDFHSLFKRVDIDLGNSSAQQKSKPTNQRKLEAVLHFDPDLEELFFQFGRYLLISSSRTSLPANLQGLWNDVNTPPWHADYHTNINIQMNYWPAEVTNLGELHLPLFNLIKSQLPFWRLRTRESKELLTPKGKHPTKGFTVTSHNIFGGMGGVSLGGAKTDSAWYAQHFWWHYAFGLNKTYLKDTAYPYMKEVTEFWEEQLKDINGSLVVPNGWSPEHGPREDGCSYNQEIVWDLLTNYIKAADILGVDKDYRNKMKSMRDRLLVPGIGSFGQLLEWMHEKQGEKDDHHRHTSHLFGVFPGHQFNFEETPKHTQAALVSLKARGIDPKSDVREWSFAWRTALYARLRDGENAHNLIKQLFSDRNTCHNLFGLHPPMQIDGNFGATAAITEMLVQSHTQQIELLVALPKEWNSGHVRGLRARGGYEVDVQWHNNTLKSAVIKTVGGGDVKVKFENNIKLVKFGINKAVKLDHVLNEIH